MSEEKGEYAITQQNVKQQESPEFLPQTTPATLLNLAISKGAEIEKLSQLMELQVKWEEREARKSYVQAMAAFKAEPLSIEKDKHVKYKVGQSITEYDHPSLANITEKTNTGLGKHGLSSGWLTTQVEGKITVTCKITHIAGHSEETSLTSPPDTTGGKNAIQAIASTISYLERYTLLALTGLAAKDMLDDDGQVTEDIEYITETQINLLKKERDLRKVDGKMFLEHFDVVSLEQLPAKRFGEAMELMRAKPIPTEERQPGDENDSTL